MTDQHNRFARPKTPLPVPVEIDDETSQRYDIPEERAAYRAKRDTKDRLVTVERKVDTVVEGMAGMKGSVDTMIKLQHAAEERADKAAARQAALWMAALKVLVPVIVAVGGILAAYWAGGAH